MEDEDEFSEDEDMSDESQQLSQMELSRIYYALHKEIKKTEEEETHWKEKVEENQEIEQMCFGLLVFALGDDFIDIIADLVSFGLLASLTFPVPGIIRMIIATKEREPKPDSFIRSIIAMMIKAIPVINALPVTTINLIVDWVQAHFEAEQAKNKQEALHKKIIQLKKQVRQITRNMRFANVRTAA